MSPTRQISVMVLAGLLLCPTISVLLCSAALAQRPVPRPRRIDVQARQLVGQMRRRGEPTSELHLALAALFARVGNRRAFKHLEAARKLGIDPVRLALVQAPALQRLGRYDEALSTLVRVLAQDPNQPQALVMLWTTLYEALLRGRPLESDVDAIRKRLADFGLHFPTKLDFAPGAEAQSRRLTALGYNALLAKRARYAAELFEAAIDYFPSNARAHRGLGMARAEQFDYRRATGAFLLYLTLSPGAPDANEIDRRLVSYWKDRSE